MFGGDDGVGGIRCSVSVDVLGHCMDTNKEEGIHAWGSGLLAGEGVAGWAGGSIDTGSPPRATWEGRCSLGQSGWDEGKTQKHRTCAGSAGVKPRVCAGLTAGVRWVWPQTLAPLPTRGP